MLLIGKLDKNPFNLDPFYIWLKDSEADCIYQFYPVITSLQFFD